MGVFRNIYSVLPANDLRLAKLVGDLASVNMLKRWYSAVVKKDVIPVCIFYRR